MAERIAVYVDGANAYFAQKEALNWWIDWPSFLGWAREGRELVSARWYQAYRGTPEPEQERFLHHLTLIGFAVRKKVLKSIYDRESGQSSLKGNLDVELAIDALTEVDHYDTAMLVTGDSDFVPLVEALRSRGKRVMVAATQQNVAVELRQAVGVGYVDLRELRHRIESDKRPAEPSRPVESARRAEAGNGSGLPPAIHEDVYEDDDELRPDYDPSPPGVPDEDIELPQEGEIVRCNVQAVKKYGVFLDLHPDVKTLLHVKDMNRGYVADAGELYHVGEEIMVQVVGIDWQPDPPEVRVAVVSPEMEY
jgi:uncharacterized LabA/DUF88 family protein